MSLSCLEVFPQERAVLTAAGRKIRDIEHKSLRNSVVVCPTSHRRDCFPHTFINCHHRNRILKHWLKSKHAFLIFYMYIQSAHNPERNSISHSNTKQVLTTWQMELCLHSGSIGVACTCACITCSRYCQVAIYSALQTHLIFSFVLQRGQFSKRDAALGKQW